MTGFNSKCVAVKYGAILGVILFALAVRSGDNADASRPIQDSCAFVQNSIQWKSGGSRSGQSLLQARFTRHLGTSWPEIGTPAVGLSTSDPNGPVSLSGDRDTIDIIRDGNETVVVNVSASKDKKTHAGNLSAKVAPNTTDITVANKVISGDKKHVTSEVGTRSKKGHGKENASESWNTTGHSPPKAFSKENITTHKHILNITRVVNDTHGSGTHKKTQNVTITETTKTVSVASTYHIASIYIVLFVPVIAAWVVYLHQDSPAHLYIWLLPFTMCAMSIGQDLVNQSLTMILEAPNAISAIQGYSMTLATLLWICCVDRSALKLMQLGRLKNWFGVAICFAIYQLMNHWVYAVCSLSERTVITNLSPLASLTLERLIMPVAFKPSLSFNSKLALALMVMGALLFSFQCPSFTLDGVCVALLLLLATVPYRLAQRQFLVEMPDMPLANLACIDGMVLFLPSAIFSYIRNVHFWTVVETSTDIPILFMLVLSILTFVGLHICGLALLRMASATSYLVYSNIASLVTVSCGIFFFGDRALATTLACIGLAANVASGIWYTAEAQSVAHSQKKESDN